MCECVCAAVSPGLQSINKGTTRGGKYSHAVCDNMQSHLMCS